MTNYPHIELNAPRSAFSRRRVLQSLGATVALAGLAGCGGDSEDEGGDEGAAEDEETNGEAPEEDEAEDEDD